MRRATKRTWLIALLLGIIATIAGGYEPGAVAAGDAKPPETAVESPGLPCSPSDWAIISTASTITTNPTPAKTPAKSPAPVKAPTPGIVAGVNQPYVAMHWEFQNAAACQAFHLDGVHFLTRYDRFADILYPPGDQKIVAALHMVRGLRWSELAQLSVTPPPGAAQPDVERPRSPPEAVVRGGMGGLTGQGVIIAVLDTGIDFHHPDFINYDTAGRPTSRIRYFWDTLVNHRPADKIGSASPVSFPDGSSIGTIYSRAELTADLRAAKPQITGTDWNGHGTACAGIAAGNGNGLKKQYIGVAPDADLLIVRIGDADAKMVSQYLQGAAFDWLEKVAGSTPMVVSCSFGALNSGHDGFQIMERQIDSRFSLDRAGRAILIAAGNNGVLPMHAGFTLAGAAAPGELSWKCPQETALQIFVQANDPADFQVTAGDMTKLSNESSSLNPLSGQVVITEVVPAGSGSLTVISKSGRACTADAYLLDTTAKFTGNNAVIERMIESPGCSANAITVGSYNWNNIFDLKGKLVSLRDSAVTNRAMTIGELSAYSCPGFWRFGNAIKPEITAPGQWWTATAPLVLPAVDPDRESSGRYRGFNGTSAATPYAAGVVALMLQKTPKLTLGQIRDLLKTCATSDEFTGTVPNVHWGYGKLDVAAVGRLIKQAGK